MVARAFLVRGLLEAGDVVLAHGLRVVRVLRLFAGVDRPSGSGGVERRSRRARGVPGTHTRVLAGRPGLPGAGRVVRERGRTHAEQETKSERRHECVPSQHVAPPSWIRAPRATGSPDAPIVDEPLTLVPRLVPR